MLRYSGDSSGDAARRQSSISSHGSLDVAASLFSSMRTLEASGRNLSSLRLCGESTAERSLLPPGVLPHINSRVDGAPVGGLATGSFGMGTGGHNYLRLPTGPTGFMQMLPPSMMGGTLPRRSLEMDAILRQQQQISANRFQAPRLLDTIRGGYLPSSSLRGSISNFDVDEFTTHELIHELNRRRSESCMASAVMNGFGPSTSAMLPEKISKPFLVNELQPRGSLDSSQVNFDSASLYQMHPTNRQGSGASPDSGSVKVASKTNPTQTLAVTSIPTCFKPSKKSAKKRRKDENVEVDVSGVREDEAPSDERMKAKRTQSTTSLDVLLTALGDDLEKLEPSVVRRGIEDEARRRLSKDSHFTKISDEQSQSDSICQPATQTQINLSRRRQQSHLATLLDCRPSLPTPSLRMESDAMLYPASGPNLDYVRRMQASNLMMTSLESTMIRNDSDMSEVVLRDFQARREFALRMVQNNMQSDLGPPAPPLPPNPEPIQELQLPVNRYVSISDCDKSKDDSPIKDTKQRQTDEPPIKDTKTKQTDEPPIKDKIQRDKPTIKENADPLRTSKVPPKEALELFLSTYGEKGETLREAMLKAISETESSLATIHSWDRSQGLRKCHSRTVVKTRRSRAHLKAFLMGVAPPIEPHQNRKRSKKSNGKNMVDIFGKPRDRVLPSRPILVDGML